MSFRTLGPAAALLVPLLVVLVPLSADPARLRLATTTSTADSGLLDWIHPSFEKLTGLTVDVIAVGSGKALALGTNGDVDVVLVHDRKAEDAFVKAGSGVNRRDVMHNDFVVVGPPSDPAGIAGLSSVVDAFARIAAAGAAFVSRGDASGTNTKELDLWALAGITPKGTWYKEAGQGMGTVLTMAADMRAYTLADRGTYIAMRHKVDLKILKEGDPGLLNPYGVIAVNPQKHPSVNFKAAMLYIDWITSAEGQGVIASYTLDGEQLFTPDALK